MSQTPVQRNVDGVLPPGEVIEEIVDLAENTAPSGKLPSYHPTRWEIVNRLLAYIDEVTNGRAGVLQRITTFLIIGGTCALINLAIQFVCLKINMPIDPTVHNMIASLTGTEISLVINFLFNDYFTFRHLPGHQRSILARFVRFHMTALGGVILTTVIQMILVTFAHLNPLIAQAIAIIIVLFYNFIFHHIFTYRHVAPAKAS